MEKGRARRLRKMRPGTLRKVTVRRGMSRMGKVRVPAHAEEREGWG